MEAMDIQAVESKLSDVTVTAIPMSGKSIHKDTSHGGNSHATISTVPAAASPTASKDKDKDSTSKYAQLLAVIEEMGKEVRPSYSGSRSSAERLKRGIVHARILVRECLIETESMVVTWNNKWRWHTTFSADSVEWCPLEPYKDVLVCGTYQLDKTEENEATDKSTKQTRLGRIYLFRIGSDTTDLQPLQAINTSGILDQKWCYHEIQGHPVLAVVTSLGNVALYRLVDENGTLSLNLWIEHSVGEDILALSLDWSTNKIKDGEPKLVISDSSGRLMVLRVVGNGLEEIGTWSGHGFEAWIGAFNYWEPNLFYSGGDDCVFKSYDLRVPDIASWTNRSHEAGVTSIRSHVDEEHQLLTGSYDEKIRLWDTRTLKRCITETDVRGGVWRLKWHPFKPCYILAACMYGGFRVVKFEEELKILCEYLEHESIAYGADWRCDQNMPLVATCSFYDCKLHIGEVNL